MDRDQVKKTLLDQQLEKTSARSLVIRSGLSEAKKSLERPLVLVVTGVRRCGKSTFCHQLLDGETYGYINFDDERLITLRVAQLQMVLEVILEIVPDSRTLLLDEIQNIKGWELFVNRILRAGYRVIVTGSNSKLLSSELATHLTGRHRTFELYPFSFSEYLRAKTFEYDLSSLTTQKSADMSRYFNTFLKEGGFPEMVIRPYEPRYLRELYDKIISKDIVQRKKIRNSAALKELALLAISQSGSQFTFQKFSKTLGIKGVNTTKNYLSYLEDAYLLETIQPYSNKVKEQIRLPRKIYAIDNGMFQAMNTRLTPDFGSSLETFVFGHLKMQGKEIKYYLSPTAEVDFLVHKGRSVAQLIQVCWSVSDRETLGREIKALKEAAAITRCKNLILLTPNGEQTLEMDDLTVQVLPVWRWALENEITKPPES